MNQVKAPFLLKINIVLISFLLLFLLIIIKNLVLIFYVTEFKLIELIFFIIIIIILNFLSFFFSLKGSLLAVRLSIISSLFTFGSIFYFLYLSEKVSDFVDIIFIIVISSLIFLFYHLTLLVIYGLRLKSNNKYFTNEKQHINYLKSLSFIIVFLLVFKFSYYDIDEKIEVPPKGYFITKYEDKEVNSEKNLYFLMKDFEKHRTSELEEYKYLKEKMFACIYENTCYGNIEDWQNSINSFRGTYRKEIQEEIDKLETEKAELENSIKQEDSFYLVYEVKNKIKDIDYKISSLKEKDINKIDSDELVKIEDKDEKEKLKAYLKRNLYIFIIYKDKQKIEKAFNDFFDLKITEYFKEDETKYDEYIIVNDFIYILRDIRYRVIYLLKNNNEKQAIEEIETALDFCEKLINGDSVVIELVIGNLYYKYGLETIEKILENFYLSDDSKNKLKEILSKKIDINEVSENISKVEYKFAREFFKEVGKVDIAGDVDYIDKLNREYFYNLGNNKLGLSEEYLNKNFENGDDDKFKKSIFKKNFVSKYYFQSPHRGYSNIYIKDLETTLQKREGLLKKLD